MAFYLGTGIITLATSGYNLSSQIPDSYSQAGVGGILMSVALPLVTKRNSYGWFNHVKFKVWDSLLRC